MYEIFYRLFLIRFAFYILKSFKNDTLLLKLFSTLCFTFYNPYNHSTKSTGKGSTYLMVSSTNLVFKKKALN